MMKCAEFGEGSSCNIKDVFYEALGVRHHWIASLPIVRN